MDEKAQDRTTSKQDRRQRLDSAQQLLSLADYFIEQGRTLDAISLVETVKRLLEKALCAEIAIRDAGAEVVDMRWYRESRSASFDSNDARLSEGAYTAGGAS